MCGDSGGTLDIQRNAEGRTRELSRTFVEGHEISADPGKNKRTEVLHAASQKPVRVWTIQNDAELLHSRFH